MCPTTPPRTGRSHDRRDLTAVAAELVDRAGRTADVAEFLTGSLPVVLAAAGGDCAVVARADAGRWSTVAATGSARSLAVDLLGEVLDGGAAAAAGRWVAAPLAPRSANTEVLSLHAADPAMAMPVVERLAPVLGGALAAVKRCREQRRRIERLEAVLEIAGQWNRAREVEPLLIEMAEAATRLLGADRASIFLWDRHTHSLVGRPALGIEQGELRIADDRGVVGQVIQTGQPRRVVAATEPDAIDHRVDQQVKYRTETLLCVPMRGSSGELFGAFETINKLSGVFDAEDEAALVELAAHAAIALENARDRQELLATNRQMAQQAAQRVQLTGESPAVDALRSTIAGVADTELAVLILGENGTGKEVVAQSIHYLGRRCNRPFIAVNCAAISETLAESELFGHEKGAFTDARESRPGKFELASGGTLLLDEIGELSAGSQAKLLRVLEEKVLVRVGGSMPIHCDARVLAATNQDLAEMVRQKRFRQDLYFRLNVVTLELPPLRERGDDILLLAEQFLVDFCRQARRKTPQLSAEARQWLLGYPWPGNVRELRNLMERLAYLSAADRIEAADLTPILNPRDQLDPPGRFTGTLADATEEFQREYIHRAIEASSGNLSRAAEALGLHRSNFYRKLRRLDEKNH